MLRRKIRSGTLKAMEQGTDSFYGNNVITDVSEREARDGERILGSRWVLCKKSLPEKTTKYKAWLVISGVGDCEEKVSSDAPTMSKAGMRMILSGLAMKQWKPRSTDYSTASLKREPLTRRLFLKPQKEFLENEKMWKWR